MNTRRCLTHVFCTPCLCVTHCCGWQSQEIWHPMPQCRRFLDSPIPLSSGRIVGETGPTGGRHQDGKALPVEALGKSNSEIRELPPNRQHWLTPSTHLDINVRPLRSSGSLRAGDSAGYGETRGRTGVAAAREPIQNHTTVEPSMTPSAR